MHFVLSLLGGLAVTHAVVAPVQSAETYVEVERGYRVPFQMQGQIKLGSIRPSMSGVEMFLSGARAPKRSEYPEDLNTARLFHHSSNSLIPIRDLAQLQGYVKIGSNRDALAFARLSTRPDVPWPVFGQQLEVVAREDLAPDFTYGSQRLLDALKKAPDGHWGVISKRVQSRLSLKPVKVLSVGDAYEISRDIVCLEEGTIVLRRLIEKIGPDGSYHRQVIREIAWASDAIVQWRFGRTTLPVSSSKA